MPQLTPEQQISAVSTAQGIHGQNLATIADNIIYLLEQNSLSDAEALLTTYRLSGSSSFETNDVIAALRPTS